MPNGPGVELRGQVVLVRIDRRIERRREGIGRPVQRRLSVHAPPCDDIREVNGPRRSRDLGPGNFDQRVRARHFSVTSCVVHTETLPPA